MALCDGNEETEAIRHGLALDGQLQHNLDQMFVHVKSRTQCIRVILSSISTLVLGNCYSG